ncbi:uncharacterized protein FA14DRAFT_68836 [Meira miltonrushii]|uniref:Uncharacterized protein n=1 Tax=Meira miltonrushii TaxID=1280837 RepID=A0A316V966_9BASI|nr:uncharacterized protein FA14DRAFT_68836 [Meira miltonrushii]PWN34127.1 hypothetical protein FA14DRAFT_68836 [Meira miltonrushii]
MVLLLLFKTVLSILSPFITCLIFNFFFFSCLSFIPSSFYLPPLKRSEMNVHLINLTEMATFMSFWASFVYIDI